MKKQVKHGSLCAIALVVLLVLLSACGQAGTGTSAQSSASTAGDGYTERTFKVISTVDGAPSELSLRFYDDAPNVPYFGLAQYKTLVFGDKTSVESDGKTATLTTSEGGTVTVDDAADKISSNNLARFRRYEKPQLEGGKPCGILDFAPPFLRIASFDYQGEAQPITLDYGAYHIDLHVDQNDAYLPLASTSDLMFEGAAALFYNGTNLYLVDQFVTNITELDPNYYQQLEANHERAQDMVDFTYNNLCFLMDNLCGNTGSAALDELIAQKGLDEALSYNDITQKTRDMLKSTDFFEFLTGTSRLANLAFDGHTYLADSWLTQSEEYLASPQGDPELISEIVSKSGLPSSYKNKMYPDDGASPYAQRAELLGEIPPAYREYGSTAVITLESFVDYDKEGWEAHYANGAPLPTGEQTPDLVGTLAAGLQKAKENPNIKYIVLDVSCNLGGSSDLLAAVDALLFGKAEIRFYDQTNQQLTTVPYVVDSLFDKSFATDAYASATNFTYAVLTSHQTFSCANTFASHCKDAGVPVLGEQSGGGEYTVAATYFPEGLIAQVGSATGRFVDAQGNRLENGVPVDVDLVKTDENGVRDYSDFYSVEKLDEVMKALDNKN